MNGDEVGNALNQTTQLSYFIGFIFIITFTFFGITVLSNIFLIIVGDSFMQVRDKGKFDWIKHRKYNKQDNDQSMRFTQEIKEDYPFSALAGGGNRSPGIKRKTSIVDMLDVQD